MFGDLIDYLPIVIRIGAVIMVLAILYDYIKREWARSLVNALKELEAFGMDHAVCTDELEMKCKGARRIVKQLLTNEYSSLRRVVKCVSTEKEETTQKRKKRSAKLTGKEKWYLQMPTASDEEENTVKPSIPYVLRDGGESSKVKLIIGIVIVFVFSELIIHFLPQIESFFSGVSSLGKD